VLVADPRSLEGWRRTAGSFVHNERRIATYRSEPHDGSRLLILHGFPTAAWDFHLVWPDLARRYNLLALDFLGFGSSDKPANQTYSIGLQADIVEALMKSIGARRTHVLAHDYGVTVAQELLARAREALLTFEITSVSFLNGGLFPESTRPRLIQQVLASPLGPLVARFLTEHSVKRSLARVFGPETGEWTQEIDQMWKVASSGGGLAIAPSLLSYIAERRARRDRWVGALETARCPVGLIAGEADPVSGLPTIERWRELLPDAPVLTLPGVGHWPQIEAPAAVLQAMR
jgi:pimeloyl-ACP methyl ester carboxylesterase